LDSCPEVAVVVIGRNEGPRLETCLSSVQAMDYARDRVDIVYVDSSSTDDSVERAKKLGVRVVALPPGAPTAARGRNAGLLASQAPYVFFVDGDTIIHPQFLSKAIEFMEEREYVAAVSGYRREIHPQHSFYNRVLDLDWISPAGEAGYCGGDAVIRRAVLEQVGPYAEDLVAGEEPELCHRIRQEGFKIFRLDLPMTMHDLNIHKFSGYWIRCFRTGYAYAEVSARTNGQTFGRESRRNQIQTIAYMAVPLVLLFFLKLLAIPVMIGGVALVLARTVWRARWRKASFATSLAYAIHGHFCQFPIWFGQLKFYINRRRKVTASLIEYK